MSHSDECAGSSNKTSFCQCRQGLSAGTVDNNIGKLRSIFREAGRGSHWIDELHIGNPATHYSVKQYQSLVLEEQTIARTFPRQATPLFLDKLKMICSHLRSQVAAPGLKPAARYIIARDLAFFTVDFFSGDRGSDLGRVKADDVLTVQHGDGFLVNQVFGKTLRGNGANVFGIKPVKNTSYCPMSNLQFYIALTKKMSINLKGGYLFRVTNRHGQVTDSPFVGSAIANRLKKHLTDLKIDSGESMHSFRSGCSITLSLLGVSYQQVAKHVGWKSLETTAHYCQTEKVMSPDDPSSILSRFAAQSRTDTSTVETLTKDFRDKNSLSAYKPIF